MTQHQIDDNKMNGNGSLEPAGSPWCPLQSSTVGKLAEAMAKAQSQMSNVVKSHENPFYKSKYVSLAALIDEAREPLSSNGLAVVQIPCDGADGAVCLVTTILHSSGEWLRGALKLRPVRNDPQGIGAAITYARRQSFAAIVGLGAEDDDAEASMRGKRSTNPGDSYSLDFCEYGKNNGQRWDSLGDEDLDWYHKDLVKHIANPKLAKHKKRYEAVRSAIVGIMECRVINPVPKGGNI